MTQKEQLELAENVDQPIVDTPRQETESTEDRVNLTLDQIAKINQVAAVDNALRQIELSVVMPCLNEADTLEVCIRKAQKVLNEEGIDGEIIIADNGSTDGSIELARGLGARVVHVRDKGYGNALQGGIEAARGKYVIMGDADDSYNFLEIPKFVKQLRKGYDLVQGCRLPAGGGTVLPGAMPFLHRWWGNPMFSFMVRKMFRAPINDVYCGMRGFTKKLYDRLELRSPGMEFATEMIIKSTLFENKIAEVPITLHPDGRKAHAPHLRTFRDGWRTLRFFLMYSPKWLYRIPGTAMLMFGLLAFALALPGVSINGAVLGAHTLLFGLLSILMGYQMVLFSMLTETFAVSEGLAPADQRHRRMAKWINLERGAIGGAILFLFGGCLLGLSFLKWQMTGFGNLDYSSTMRIVIPGVTAAAIGFQTIAASFFLSILRFPRKKKAA